MSDQPRPGRPGLALIGSGLITLPGVSVRRMPILLIGVGRPLVVLLGDGSG